MIVPSRQQSCFVYEILQVRAGKPGRRSRQHFDVHVRCQGDLARVHLQDTFSPSDVGSWYDNVPIEATRTEQCGIQYVRPVGCGDKNDSLVGLESIHLDQQLVQRLFPFVIAAAEAGAAVTPDCVDFVDKNDARRLLFALNEQIANPRCADADEHFNEIGTTDAEERHPGFARDGASQQRLASSRRPDEQTSFGNSAAEFREFFRIF